MLNENIKNRYKFILSKMISENYNAEGDWEQPNDVIPTTPGGGGSSEGDILRFVRNQGKQGLTPVPGSGTTVQQMLPKGSLPLDGSDLNRINDNYGYYFPNGGVQIIEIPTGSGQYYYRNVQTGEIRGNDIFNDPRWPDTWPLIRNPGNDLFSNTIDFERWHELGGTFPLFNPDPSLFAPGGIYEGPAGLLRLIEDVYKWGLDHFGFKPSNPNEINWPSYFNLQLQGIGGRQILDDHSHINDHNWTIRGKLGIRAYGEIVRIYRQYDQGSFDIGSALLGKNGNPLFGGGRGSQEFPGWFEGRYPGNLPGRLPPRFPGSGELPPGETPKFPWLE